MSEIWNILTPQYILVFGKTSTNNSPEFELIPENLCYNNISAKNIHEFYSDFTSLFAQQNATCILRKKSNALSLFPVPYTEQVTFPELAVNNS